MLAAEPSPSQDQKSQIIIILEQTVIVLSHSVWVWFVTWHELTDASLNC